MTKLLKNRKNPSLGSCGLFWIKMDKFGQKRPFLKKGTCQFLNIPTIYHRAKNQKKLMCHS